MNKNNEEKLVLKTKAFIFDIDGVLSNPKHRIEHARNKNWEQFHMLSVYDKPIIDACRVCRILSKHFDVIFLTGRPEKFREITERWLNKNIFDVVTRKNILFMRKDEDFRPSHEIKKEIYESLKENYRIIGVFEDKESVVNMWRQQGLVCFSLPDNN